MIRAIKQFFDEHLAPSPDTAQADSGHRLRVATGAILLELTRADFDVAPAELVTVTNALQTTFGLTAAETAELQRLAEAEARAATDYYQFTSLINKGFSQDEKVRIIELMWLVAYADGKLDKYEDHLIRKIAGLLHVPHKDFIGAKLRARGAHAPR